MCYVAIVVLCMYLEATSKRGKLIFSTGLYIQDRYNYFKDTRTRYTEVKIVNHIGANRSTAF